MINRCDERTSSESATGEQEVIVETPILTANDQVAEQNRRLFASKGVLVLNLISGPGAGKTSLLVKTIQALQGRLRMAVIEGDQQTDYDSRRIAETGVPVVQINTYRSCHLDATQVRRALERLSLDGVGLLFIENVGNLVCPAEFDLGESAKVVLMSVTEGEEKPAKYPLAFHLASALVFTKLDLLPYLQFDLAVAKEHARRVNPKLTFLETSTYLEGGLDAWLHWLEAQVARQRGCEQR